MKIGIGISTTNSRTKTLALSVRMFQRYTPPEEGVEFAWHIQTSFKRHSGIAAVKNDCLRNLLQEECDFIFLFDDDCFPRKKDWWKIFVEASLRTNQHHLLFLMEDWQRLGMEKVGRRKIGEENGLSIYNKAQGCCMFFTRACVEAVGAFDEKFIGYGFEHDNYTFRCRKLEFNTISTFLAPAGIEEYIHSLDIHGCAGYYDQEKQIKLMPWEVEKRSMAGDFDFDFRGQMGKEYDEKRNMPKTTVNLALMEHLLKRNNKLFQEDSLLQIPLWT